LRLRFDAGTTGTSPDQVIDLIPVRTEFVVLEGPVCIENKAWYRVRLAEPDGREGWFVETIGTGENESYTIEPLSAISVPTEAPTPGGS
jgi:hypothetical protein